MAQINYIIATFLWSPILVHCDLWWNNQDTFKEFLDGSSLAPDHKPLIIGRIIITCWLDAYIICCIQTRVSQIYRHLFS